MRIVFILIGNSRRSNYLDGDTIRYGKGGGSGTDGSTIIIAEQLAKAGHEVVITSDKLEPLLERTYAAQGLHFNAGKTVRGVIYTDILFEGVENREFDILISSLWFHDYAKLPIKVNKAIIYWCHMQWIYGIDEILKFASDNKLKLGFVHISEWEKNMTHGVVEHAKHNWEQTSWTTIPNPVMDDIINEVLATPPVRKPHKFVFHAAWARGGNVAAQAVRELGFSDSEFHAFDYLMCTHTHPDNFFCMHNAADKKTLFTHIAESEYFVYPLYTPYQDVHKDTFSCVVAEAIALGAIPVTYPLGALPEYYSGHCAWLDFPPGANPSKMQSEPLSKDLSGMFTCTDNIVRKIQYLEANPAAKQEIRSGGKQHILANFNAEKIGNQWKSFINELL
jgi:hypothetical protein